MCVVQYTSLLMVQIYRTLEACPAFTSLTFFITPEPQVTVAIILASIASLFSPQPPCFLTLHSRMFFWFFLSQEDNETVCTGDSE